MFKDVEGESECASEAAGFGVGMALVVAGGCGVWSITGKRVAGGGVRTTAVVVGRGGSVRAIVGDKRGAKSGSKHRVQRRGGASKEEGLRDSITGYKDVTWFCLCSRRLRTLLVGTGIGLDMRQTEGGTEG